MIILNGNTLIGCGSVSHEHVGGAWGEAGHIPEAQRCRVHVILLDLSVTPSSFLLKLFFYFAYHPLHRSPALPPERIPIHYSLSHAVAGLSARLPVTLPTDLNSAQVPGASGTRAAIWRGILGLRLSNKHTFIP